MRNLAAALTHSFISKSISYSANTKVYQMRNPTRQFPTQPTGLDRTRRTLVEIQNVLKNPRLSREMRGGLEQQVTLLRTDIATAGADQTRDISLEATSRTRHGSLGK